MELNATKIIFDTKMIMKRAWTCVKKHGMTLSEALKWSWAKAKEEASMCVADVIEATNVNTGRTMNVKFYADGNTSLNGVSVSEFISKVFGNSEFSVRKVA